MFTDQGGRGPKRKKNEAVEISTRTAFLSLLSFPPFSSIRERCLFVISGAWAKGTSARRRSFAFLRTRPCSTCAFPPPRFAPTFSRASQKGRRRRGLRLAAAAASARTAAGGDHVGTSHVGRKCFWSASLAPRRNPPPGGSLRNGVPVVQARVGGRERGGQVAADRRTEAAPLSHRANSTRARADADFSASGALAQLSSGLPTRRFVLRLPL